MKIILTLSDPDTPHETADAQLYVDSLKQRVEQRQYQGFPGAVLEHGDGSIWVTNVEIVLDNHTNQRQY